ncbi:MAG TPA: RodZ domain-containing protein [Actinomycetota bacterium]|nr:RodZ domain-containing protein [Actinomycetota bacterium]
MTEPITIGAYLRAGRRKRRVSIERAAEETRIRADFLMRMESDEFDFLAPPYVRGFLRSYSNFLRIDPQPLVDEFDRRYAKSRLDTDQIVALDQRRRGVPRQRRRPSSWSVAAFLAAGTLVILAIIGVLSNGNHRPPPGNNVALNSPSTSPTSTPTSTPTETPTTKPTQIAFTQGIHVKVVATRGRCWVQAMADGNDAVPIFSQTLEIGQSQMLTAKHSLKMLLGFPAGVDLIVNGHDIRYHGPPTAQTITLPQDIKSLT